MSGRNSARAFANVRFNQFDSSRSGALNSHDLQRLLAKDSMMDAREDCVKMVSVLRVVERIAAYIIVAHE